MSDALLWWSDAQTTTQLPAAKRQRMLDMFGASDPDEPPSRSYQFARAVLQRVYGADNKWDYEATQPVIMDCHVDGRPSITRLADRMFSDYLRKQASLPATLPEANTPTPVPTPPVPLPTVSDRLYAPRWECPACMDDLGSKEGMVPMINVLCRPVAHLVCYACVQNLPKKKNSSGGEYSTCPLCNGPAEFIPAPIMIDEEKDPDAAAIVSKFRFVEKKPPSPPPPPQVAVPLIDLCPDDQPQNLVERRAAMVFARATRAIAEEGAGAPSQPPRRIFWREVPEWDCANVRLEPRVVGKKAMTRAALEKQLLAMVTPVDALVQAYFDGTEHTVRMCKSQRRDGKDSECVYLAFEINNAEHPGVAPPPVPSLRTLKANAKKEKEAEEARARAEMRASEARVAANEQALAEMARIQRQHSVVLPEKWPDPFYVIPAMRPSIFAQPREAEADNRCQRPDNQNEHLEGFAEVLEVHKPVAHLSASKLMPPRVQQPPGEPAATPSFSRALDDLVRGDWAK